jgi:hypothetical protein
MFRSAIVDVVIKKRERGGGIRRAESNRDQTISLANTTRLPRKKTAGLM